MEHGIILFFLNGITIEPVFYIDEEKTKDFQEKGGLYPALSLLTHQQVSVNFGKDPFIHADQVNQFVQRIWKERDDELRGDEVLWTSLNSRSGATIPLQILDFVPKMIRDKDTTQTHDSVSNISGAIDDINLCQVCFDRNREVLFQPCGHTQFCRKCSERMEVCPLCRHKIEGLDVLPSLSTTKVTEL